MDAEVGTIAECLLIPTSQCACAIATIAPIISFLKKMKNKGKMLCKIHSNIVMMYTSPVVPLKDAKLASDS